jgi:hypothetical protein
MWLDAENLVSNDQAFDGADQNGADLSTSVIDIAGAAFDVGIGSPIKFLVQVTETHVGAAASVVATIQTSVDEAFTSPITVQAVSLTSLTAGAAGSVAQIYLPALGLKRYLRISYQYNAAVTSGKLTAGVVKDFQQGFGQ